MKASTGILPFSRPPAPGEGRALGAHRVPGGVDFALLAPHADAVQLCLFDPLGRQELARHALARVGPEGLWCGHLALSPAQVDGLVYGWRVHGPWDPKRGLRFNPAKLLLDPAARELIGHYDGSDLHLGHCPDDPARPDPRDNAAEALKARVVAELPPLTVAAPVMDPARRVLYELHVKGFTAQHPDVPPEQRGTYAGLSHPAVLEHLVALGVTTLCLLPVAHFVDEARLLACGLRNYWGYNPIAWNAPHAGYAQDRTPGGARREFRALVDAAHAAGLEVVLDVVYNHTAETDAQGPTLSLRGIDNTLYYHLDPKDPSAYRNWTGCGNSVNLDDPRVLRTVMDSLRGWVLEFGVDGFRFDLATVLARRATAAGDFDPQAPLLTAIAQDPVLRDRLMIAEPWDLGPGGYRLGAFPPGWLEWNDRFRDTLRGWWLHRRGHRGDLAQRLAGSDDVFAQDRRPACSSVNFVTAHDGFTLRDLVSYRQRHNEANGEDNRDGHGENLSVNHGVEGDTHRADVLARRAIHQRSLLASLLLSLGTPMLQAGDELGRTQGGNNNAYCQDGPVTWIDWTGADHELARFVARLLALRHAHPVLQGGRWWRAEPSPNHTRARWWTAQAQPLSGEDWTSHSNGLLILQCEGPPGERAALLIFNATEDHLDVALPPGDWRLEIDSTTGLRDDLPRPLAPRERLPGPALWLALSSPSSEPRP